MITILFFAQIRELLGESSITIAADKDTWTVEQLRDHLAAKNQLWHRVLTADKLLVAVNQTISSWDTSLQAGDEVAFFPPMTGG